MPWDPENDNRSTWKPLTPEQIRELERTTVVPRLEIVPSTPTHKHRKISPPPARPTTNKTPVFH
jgi:hypothetical protein